MELFILVLESGHDLGKGSSAIADRSVEVFKVGAVMSAEVVLKKFGVLGLIKVDMVSAELSVQLCLTLGDILLTPLFFEPGAYLGASLICLNDVEPCTVGPFVRVFCSEFALCVR